jgi:hypothetical protein
MDGLVVFALVVAALALFAALAVEFGVDSRIGFEDPSRRSVGVSS